MVATEGGQKQLLERSCETAGHSKCYKHCLLCYKWIICVAFPFLSVTGNLASWSKERWARKTRLRLQVKVNDVTYDVVSLNEVYPL